MEAQQSGFHWERTSDGMSEPCPLGRGERYEVREDEIGRFKGKGSLREGGNRNPPSLRQLQGELPRRGKRGWPGPFGDFLSVQKVTRPGAKYPFTLRSAIQIDGPMGPISPIRGKCPEGIKGVGIIGPYERDIT